MQHYLYIATAQRYSVLIHTHHKVTENFAILGMLDTSAFDAVPNYVDANVTGHLVYDAGLPLPASLVLPAFHIIDDLSLEPLSAEVAFSPVDQRISLDLNFFPAYGENRAGFNNISWVPQLVPSLYTALSAPSSLAGDATIYGPLSNTVILKKDEVVEIAIVRYRKN